MNKFNIVLLRGLNRGNAHWIDYPATLKAYIPNSQIDMIEIAGNGFRNNEITPVNPIECLNDLRNQLTFVKKNEKFLLIGVSLGGMLGLKWAEEYPNDLSGLVVINASLNQFSKPWERLKYKNITQIIKAQFKLDTSDRQREILNLTANSKDRINKFLPVFSNHSENYPVKIQNVIRQLVLANKIHIQNLNDVKTLVAQSAQDHFVNPICSKQISDYFKLNLESHPTAGHDLTFDDPEWMAIKILKYFSSLS